MGYICRHCGKEIFLSSAIQRWVHTDGYLTCYEAPEAAPELP